MNAHDVLLRPVLTEKSVRLKDGANQVTFAVHKDANKIQIRQAVEQLFDVEVIKVRTARMPGKVRGFGRRVRRRPDWKKAIVELAPGASIEFFGGA